MCACDSQVYDWNSHLEACLHGGHYDNFKVTQLYCQMYLEQPICKVIFEEGMFVTQLFYKMKDSTVPSRLA